MSESPGGPSEADRGSSGRFSVVGEFGPGESAAIRPGDCLTEVSTEPEFGPQKTLAGLHGICDLPAASSRGGTDLSRNPDGLQVHGTM